MRRWKIQDKRLAHLGNSANWFACAPIVILAATRRPTKHLPLYFTSRDQEIQTLALEPPKIVVLAQTIDTRYRAPVLLAAYSGMRWAELVGLTRKRIDLDKGVVEVKEIFVELEGPRLPLSLPRLTPRGDLLLDFVRGVAKTDRQVGPPHKHFSGTRPLRAPFPGGERPPDSLDNVSPIHGRRRGGLAGQKGFGLLRGKEGSVG